MIHATPFTWAALDTLRQRARLAVAETIVAVNFAHRSDLRPDLHTLEETYLAGPVSVRHYRRVLRQAHALKARLLN